MILNCWMISKTCDKKIQKTKLYGSGIKDYIRITDPCRMKNQSIKICQKYKKMIRSSYRY